VAVGSYKGHQGGCIREGERSRRYRRACTSNAIMWHIFRFQIHFQELAGDLLLKVNIKACRVMIILHVVYFFGWGSL
jgi:hypothetical protein